MDHGSKGRCCRLVSSSQAVKIVVINAKKPGEREQKQKVLLHLIQFSERGIDFLGAPQMYFVDP